MKDKSHEALLPMSMQLAQELTNEQMANSDACGKIRNSQTQNESENSEEES